MITVHVVDHVMTITLDRPDKLNAMTVEMLSDVIAALDRADADDDVRAVIVTGAGRAFCAGADLSGESPFKIDRPDGDGSPLFDRRRDGGGVLALRVHRSLKPIIGAINGDAVGGGASFTLAMDIRLAARTARYGFVFTRRGIVPDGCSSWFLPRIVGISTAQEWVLTGRLISAEEARERGLVRSVHEPDELMDAAWAIAREIADSASPVSVAVSRRLLWRMLDAPHPMAAHEIESREIGQRAASGDAREGVRSFLEKRPPQFPDRVSDLTAAGRTWWQEPPFDG